MSSSICKVVIWFTFAAFLFLLICSIVYSWINQIPCVYCDILKTVKSQYKTNPSTQQKLCARQSNMENTATNQTWTVCAIFWAFFL